MQGKFHLPGVSNDKATEHCSNSSTGSSHSHGGSSSTDELCSSVDVAAHSAGLEAPQRNQLLGSHSGLWCQEGSSLKQSLVQNKLLQEVSSEIQRIF